MIKDEHTETHAHRRVNENIRQIIIEPSEPTNVKHGTTATTGVNVLEEMHNIRLGIAVQKSNDSFAMHIAKA